MATPRVLTIPVDTKGLKDAMRRCRVVTREEFDAIAERVKALEEKQFGLECAVFMGVDEAKLDSDKTSIAEPERRTIGNGTRLCKCGEIELNCKCEPKTFDFATAVEHLGAGRRVRREAWPNDIVLARIAGALVFLVGNSIDRKFTGITVDDLDATDWQLVEDEM